MLVNLEYVLKIAEEKNCAIGSFNTPNLENMIAVISAAEELNVPVIIMHAQCHEEYAPLDIVGPIMLLMAKRAKVPVCVHLDHCDDLDYLKRAIDIGFTSVMLDASSLPYDENVKMTKEAVECAVDKGAKIIGVNAEDASRSNLDYLIKYASEAKKSGAYRFRYCDTLGYEDPQTTYDRIYKIAKATQMPIELHFHNDLGMATACSVMGARAAIDAGVDAYINTAIKGMGERAGNADLVSCLLACLKSAGFKGKYPIDENIKLDRAWQLAKYTAYAFGVDIPINQPAVGDNAFAHESGIHSDGALKVRSNYELYDFEELGRGEPEIIETGRMITTGEYGGIKGFRNVYNNLEIEFKDEHEARNILELARYANVHTQKP